MPPNFLIFLAIAQLIIILGHYVVYKAAVLLFAVQSVKALWVLRYIAAFLSICFLPATIYTRYENNILSRTLYRLAAAWMGIFVYVFQASILIIFLYSISIFSGSNFNWMIYAYGIGAIAFVLVIYGLIHAQFIQIKKAHVSLTNLPDRWKGKSFVFLSDTHFGQVRSNGFARRLVKKIDMLNAEFILHGGDFFDGVDMDFKAVADIFSKAKSKHGIFFATGNHESFENDDSKYTQPLSDAGIHVLNNQSVDIEGLTIIGAEYSKTESEKDFENFLSTLPVDQTKPTILIKHVPDFIDKAASAHISLMLSGHTHLGQMWPFRYITHRLFKYFDYGLNSKGDFQIYTSSGAGTYGPPMRVFTPAEIVLITLD